MDCVLAFLAFMNMNKICIRCDSKNFLVNDIVICIMLVIALVNMGVLLFKCSDCYKRRTIFVGSNDAMVKI